MVNLPYLQRGFFIYFEPATHYIFEKCKNEPTIYCIGRGHMLCLVCPRAAERSDYMNHSCYCDEAEPLVESIRCAYANAFQTENDLDVSGWWTFWPEVVFDDDRTARGRDVKVFVYE